MKNNTISIFLLLFLTFSLIGFIFIPNTKANSQDIEYEFEKVIPYNDYDTIDKTNVNLRHSNNNTSNFNATSNFDIPFNTGYPYHWITDNGGGGSLVGRQQSLDNHNWVMFLTDSSSTGFPSAKNLWYNEEFGTFEFFMRTNDPTYNSEINIIGNLGTSIFGIRIDNDKFQYYDGSWNDVGITAHNDMWFHIRMDFDCTDGGYLGLVKWYWKLYIDDTDFVYQMDGNPTWSKWVIIQTDTTDTSYSLYIDGASNPSDTSYIIGSNIVPIIEQENYNVLKPDKYEFTLDGNGVPNIIDDNPSIPFWNRNSEVHVYLSNDSYPYNFGVKIRGYTSTSDLYKVLDLENDEINITFSLYFLTVSELNSLFDFIVYSLNNTEIIRVRMTTLTSTSFRLQYYDGISYNPLVDIINVNLHDTLEFNVYINNFETTIILSHNSVYIDTYIFDLITEAKGIYNIYLYTRDNTVDSNYYDIIIDYIGIYQYNISLTQEVGYISNDLEINELLGSKYNLNTINCNDPLKIILSNTWLNNHYYNISEQKILRNGFVSEAKTINTYDWSYYSVVRPRLILMTNERIDLNDYSFSIEGVLLLEKSNSVIINEIYPDYSYLNQNENYSYFYVNDNKLYGKMEITQNDVWERMRVDFYVPNIITDNKTLKFHYQDNGIGKNTFEIYFLDWSKNVYEYKTSITNTYAHLPYNKILNIFSIIFDDIRYNNNYTGYISEGYIVLSEFSGITDITILTTTIINMMIPILLIFVPTLAIYFVIGKKSIIPMLILMTIICYISVLISLEIFVVMLFALGCGLFLQYKISKEVI